MKAHSSRRDIVTAFSLGMVLGPALARAQAAGVNRLVLVHGRSQQGRNPPEITAEWTDALREGAKAAGGALSGKVEIRMPYYGDILDRYAKEFDIPLGPLAIQTKGAPDDEFLAFEAEVVEAIRMQAGVTNQAIDAQYGTNPKQKGPQNWEWVQAIIRAIDKYGGGMSSDVLEAFMRDVFLYTNRAGVRDEIDRVVGPAIDETPCVVVGHSLGSVVSYNILRSDRRKLDVRLYVTLGCPLGIRAIRDQLKPLRYPDGVGRWYNAFDTRDVVSLYPLDQANFPVTPAIENYPGIKNRTSNRHGIIGYLDDPNVAKTLLGALVT